MPAQTQASQLTTLPYGDSTISLTLREGSVWLYAKDVCAALGLRNVSQALTKLDDDEKAIINRDTVGGPQDVLFVSEPGAYRLAFTSRKPGAEAFKRWLAHEVIPAIRRTGAYSPVPSVTPAAARGSEKIAARHSRRIRHAKFAMIESVMRLDALGVEVASINMATVLDFGRRLKAIGAR